MIDGLTISRNVADNTGKEASSHLRISVALECACGLLQRAMLRDSRACGISLLHRPTPLISCFLRHLRLYAALFLASCLLSRHYVTGHTSSFLTGRPPPLQQHTSCVALAIFRILAADHVFHYSRPFSRNVARTKRCSSASISFIPEQAVARCARAVFCAVVGFFPSTAL